MGFPGGKESACDAGDLCSIPGEGDDNPLHYSCLENSTDRGAWCSHELQSVGHDSATNTLGEW